MRKINQIIIHCSASPFGNVSLIREWHTARGWRDIGYHYVIGNGHPKTSKRFIAKADGLIEPGRPLDHAGAHAKGHNKYSIGICVIGEGAGLFTPRQIESLRALTETLRAEYGLDRFAVIGHRDVEPAKECPGFNVGAWI